MIANIAIQEQVTLCSQPGLSGSQALSGADEIIETLHRIVEAGCSHYKHRLALIDTQRAIAAAHIGELLYRKGIRNHLHIGVAHKAAFAATLSKPIAHRHKFYLVFGI